ncbi:hypothetical protein BC835DRAFT_1268552, partial [Cytidiella melzeri]
MDELGDCIHHPTSLEELRKQLMGSAKLPPPPNNDSFKITPLTAAEKQSLQLYVAWFSTNGTAAAYAKFAAFIRLITREPILSLKMARKLAMKLTNVHPFKVQICPNNCIAYAGPYAKLQQCPGKLKSHDKKNADTAPRFVSGPLPFKEMLVVPALEVIRAMFANKTTSRQMRYRDKLMQKVLHLGHEAYRDFASGKLLRELRKRGLFQHMRDGSYMMTTDGCQLTMKKQSETWIFLYIDLGLPPGMRWLKEWVMVAFAIPGPYAPGNLESF